MRRGVARANFNFNFIFNALFNIVNIYENISKLKTHYTKIFLSFFLEAVNLSIESHELNAHVYYPLNFFFLKQKFPFQRNE
jgi:ABC-type transporter Mla maintaining outer membrane lipid asymmetry ATPase subunit MlaF